MALEDIARKPPETAALPSVARLLLATRKLTPEQVNAVHQRMQRDGSDFLAVVIDAGLLPAAGIAETISQALVIPYIDLDAVESMRLPADLLDPRLCLANKVVPLGRRQNRLVVASADPSNRETVQNIKFVTQTPVEWVVAEYDKIAAFLDQAARAGGAQSSEQEFEFGELDGVIEEDTDSAAPGQGDVDDAPVVRFLQKMIFDAVRLGASDLHFEPYEFNYRVRFRIDGELREYASPPLLIKEKLASRIKVISRMDIAERRVPQDGRTKMRVAGKSIDFRVSTLPTLFGEKIVIRILDSSSAKLGIDALGYEVDEKKRLLSAIERPYGMILVTGPTGSGKTVSLYTCLNLLNRPGVNISTAEDPSEINLPGVNQVNVNDKAGLTFAAALKSFLRQDPDIIMVGEIRDLETADIAMKAAQTGHLVLSTLHTNDAPSTLTRLRNMGIAPFNIASSVILITAQRLAKKLCSECREPTDLPLETLMEAGFSDADLASDWTAYKAVGCPACNNGYKGRVGIYQVMPISEEIQRIILRDGSAMEIEEQAQREGVRSLRQSGLQKVRLGITSLEEIIAVTNE